jgi:hypothetical protein
MGGSFEVGSREEGLEVLRPNQCPDQVDHEQARDDSGDEVFHG